MRVLSFELMAHVPITLLSILIIPCGYYIHVNSFCCVLEQNQYSATLVAWVVLRQSISSSASRDFLQFIT